MFVDLIIIGIVFVAIVAVANHYAPTTVANVEKEILDDINKLKTPKS